VNGHRPTARGVRQRAGEAVSLVRSEGPNELWRRLVRREYARVRAAELEFPLHPGDVVDAETVSWTLPEPRRPGEPLSIGWVMHPPGPGSGGHTTAFRMMRALADRGHACTVQLYDRFTGPVERHAEVIRASWPWLDAEVVDARTELVPQDVLVATSWDTAHVLASRGRVPGHRMYFVQDFEPYFYGHGSQWALAAATYGFGFDTITVGRMLAALLEEEYAVDATVAEFGCDTDVYRLTGDRQRNGVVFYARPDVPRRGFELGMLALREFHRRHPDQVVHLFGETVPDPGFPVVQHGRRSPAELADLYNRCLAGLALSFTNVSLVPVEMIACGAVPVVNESRHARPGLTNPHVAWTQPTPGALAGALSRAVVHADAAGRARTLAASVAGSGWTDAQEAVVAAVERRAYGPRGDA